MKILVTGAAGFIGSHVAEAYLADGHTVAVVDDLSTGKRENLPIGATLYEGSIEDLAFLSTAFADFQPELVNHHAAQVSVVASVANPVLDARLNVLGTLNVLMAARQAGVGKIVYAASGGSMYGTPSVLPCTEETAAHPESFYALSKETGEYYVRMFAKLFGLRATVLRYGNVYGPRQDPGGEAGVCAIFAGRMLKGEPVSIFGDGSQVRDYVYVKDVAAASVAAVGRGEGDSFNIGTGIGTSTMQIFQALKQATGYALEPVMAPSRPGELQTIYLDASKAAGALDWHARYSLEEGISETVAWYRAAA